MLKKFWNEFLLKANKQKSIVFVEGGKRQVCSSEEEAISKGAESNLITYLADKESIETFSPEPPEPFRFEELLKRFTKEEIIYYEFARVTFQWNRYLKKPDFKMYITDSLKNDKKNSGWTDFDFSIENMLRIEKSMFNRNFDQNDKDFYYNVTNPTTNFSRINELSKFEDSGFRDPYILSQIEKYWNNGQSLFIVYGCSHAVMHEQAINHLL